MAGRTDYEERKQERINRLRAASEKAAKESAAAYKHSHDLVKNIPLGQPNIIGRPALPRLREKSLRAWDKSIELDEKADYYAQKADAAEKNRAISSDDPEAIEKLKAKIAELEAERERVKAANKEARKNGQPQADWWVLPYISRDIREAKKRIEQLERVGSMPAETIEFDGGVIESCSEQNRIMVRFDYRPDDEMRRQLKQNGFRWAPSNQAWQRLRTPQALRVAVMICKGDEE